MGSTMRFICIALGLAPLLYCSTSASSISFTSSPPIVIQDLTKLLTLRCSLSDTVIGVNSSAPVVDPGTNAQLATINARHVTSIVVTRGDRKVHVATVSQFDAAHALADFDSLMVTGDVSGSGTEKGFLELTWTYPGINQSNSYNCEVNAIDPMGHNIVYNTQVEFGVRSATEEELVQHIHDLEAEKDANEKKLTDLESAIMTIQAQLAHVQKPHIEQGTTSCGNSNNWANVGGDDREKVVTVTFSQPYDTKPTVQVGMTMLDHQNNENTRVDLSVRNVNTRSFQLVCATWAGSHMYNVGVQWLSTNS